MTTMTIAPASSGFSDDELARLAGRADAYDDETTVTLDQLVIRARWIAELHPNLAYAEGYNAYVQGVQQHMNALTGRTTHRTWPGPTA
ncbi:hypothetical protein [Streptomyces cylindrosporus]|uniref:Uncharacterized protein n=1 Tax=Streptomyces cylindrosporus TaxID=2927583 RepID=A0ABS9YPH0_9ACTN|nr:hypothetical protein [Streptomyces cylindrosporus]MCI3279170.1 hypothetical protein [Streptomyces cylindrosporus]